MIGGSRLLGAKIQSERTGHMKAVEKAAAGKALHQKSDRAKIVLIDDDPVYGAVIRRWAELEKVNLDVYNSLDDLGFLGLLSKYDVVIVDYDLGELNGKDVADYMATLFNNKPMVMISLVDRSTEIMNCPSCVKAFMKKSAGYARILDTALKLGMEKKSAF
jgi:DNA-binding NtrC family response regulator